MTPGPWDAAPPGVLPAVVAGAAVALVVLLAAPVRSIRPGPGSGRARWAGAGAGALLVAVPALAGPRWLLLALLALAVGYGGRWLWRLREDRVRAERNAERVRQACELLAAELVAGRPPGEALDRVAEDWDALAPVAAAHALGGSVPDAWRDAADLPGAGSLRLVAAAWEVSSRTGHGLAAAVSAVADGLRRDATTRRVVASELASARATARLVAVLPVPALLMGSGTGGRPWAFLLGTPAGLACLAGGLLLAGTGLAWIERIAAGVVADP